MTRPQIDRITPRPAVNRPKNGDLTDAPVTNTAGGAMIRSGGDQNGQQINIRSVFASKAKRKGDDPKGARRKLFLSESAISKWEKGKSYPDITMIPDICSVLDISEHELISGANDTEYHEMKRDARVYRKITGTFFWGFTGAYALALIICFICDLAVNHRFTFFPVVFGSLLTAFSFVPTFTRFTEKHKLAVFTGSTYLSLVLLFVICCANTGRTGSARRHSVLCSAISRYSLRSYSDGICRQKGADLSPPYTFCCSSPALLCSFRRQE